LGSIQSMPRSIGWTPEARMDCRSHNALTRATLTAGSPAPRFVAAA
jgi:hypothetical protein